MIVGTHNSGAYVAEVNTCCFRERIRKNVICQDVNVFNQLVIGARAFDFKVEEINSEYFCVNKFKCCRLDDAFKDIIKFSRQYEPDIIRIFIFPKKISNEQRFVDFINFGYGMASVCTHIDTYYQPADSNIDLGMVKPMNRVNFFSFDEAAFIKRGQINVMCIAAEPMKGWYDYISRDIRKEFKKLFNQQQAKNAKAARPDIILIDFISPENIKYFK